MKKLMKLASSIYSEVCVLVAVLCVLILNVVNGVMSVVLQSVLICIAIAFVVMAVVYRKFYKQKDEDMPKTIHNYDELPRNNNGECSFDLVNIGDEIIVPFNTNAPNSQTDMLNLNKRVKELGAILIWDEKPENKNFHKALIVKLG